MPARDVELVEAAVDHVNAGTYSHDVAARRVFAPRMEAIRDDLQVMIAGGNRGAGTAERSGFLRVFEIDVAIAKRLQTNAPAEVDALLLLGEEITERLELAQLASAVCIAWEDRLRYDPERLTENEDGSVAGEFLQITSFQFRDVQ